MTITEMLRTCGDGISNEAAQTIEVLEEQLKAATERAEAWKELSKIQDELIDCYRYKARLDVDIWDRYRVLRERLGEP